MTAPCVHSQRGMDDTACFAAQMPIPAAILDVHTWRILEMLHFENGECPMQGASFNSPRNVQELSVQELS